MMKFPSQVLALGLGCLTLALTGPAARATDLLNDPADVITAANPTQMGRISRDTSGRDNGYGLQQTWTPSLNGETAYPGAVNLAVTYNFAAYTFTPAQIGDGQYVQIDFDEPSGNNLFVSAWTVFNGTSSVATGTGWLGDAGQSGNYQGAADPRYFNVVVPAGQSLVVVVNTTPASTAGLNETYGIQVEAFSDASYTDAVIPAPEPSTWAMLGAGGVLFGGAAMARRRRHQTR